MPPTSPRTSGTLSQRSRGDAGQPLAAVVSACQTAMEATVVAAAAEAAALALWLAGATFGRALAIGAGAVLLIAGLRWANLRIERNDLYLELLISGSDPSIAALERERRRLLDPGYRHRLARSLEDLAGGTRPLCCRRVLTAVEPQLWQVAALLRADGATLRGVALVELLLTCGDSPLYGHRVAPLREELVRARYLLSGPAGRSSPTG